MEALVLKFLKDMSLGILFMLAAAITVISLPLLLVWSVITQCLAKKETHDSIHSR